MMKLIDIVNKSLEGYLEKVGKSFNYYRCYLALYFIKEDRPDKVEIYDLWEFARENNLNFENIHKNTTVRDWYKDYNYQALKLARECGLI